MKDYLEKLMRASHLTKEEVEQVTNLCLTEEIPNTQIAAFLTALRIKGETPEEIAGIANVIREQSVMSDIQLANVMDNCGTGGDRSNSFNISTTSAFVLAGAGIPIAKHGNRSVSSKTGSADVLEELGVSLTMTKGQIEKTLRENNIVFLFAPHVHEKLKPFMQVRQQLGLPTIFNLIGPLTNPIELESQLVGVYDRERLVTVAKALQTLGRKRALVLNGAGNMDEGSLAGDNQLVLLENDTITTFTIHPNDLGLPVYDNEEIRGGDAKRNAEILLSVLRNEASPYLDTVLFNVALGLYANGKTRKIQDGIAIAKESIQSGRALEKLHYLIEASKQEAQSIIS